MTATSGSDALTLEDLQRFLALPGPEDALNPYLDAASVLEAFDPLELVPRAGPDVATEQPVGPLLRRCEPLTSGPHRGLYTLTLPERRAGLLRLGSRSQMAQALELNRDRADTPLQRMFECVVAGEALELRRLEREELTALFTVRDWLGDVLGDLPEEAALHRALTRHDRTAPMLRLLRGGFVDRGRELQQLVDYVAGPPQGEPLFVFGPGGVGKSTLMAKLIVGQLERDDRACAYVDIDRPTIQPDRPLTLLADALSQLATQLDLPATRVQALIARTAESLGRAEPGRSYESFEAPGESVLREFGELLEDAPIKRTPIIVVDTFEEAQFLGTDVVWALSEFLLDLVRRVPLARVFVCGRTLPAEFAALAFPGVFGPSGEAARDAQPPLAAVSGPVRPIDLGLLDPAPARELLERAIETSGLAALAPEELDDVIAVVSRNPMCLKLAARLLRDLGPEKLRASRSEVLAELRAEKIQALLYGRILNHVHGEDVRSIAYPGLVVRRITPEVIREVLAGPCGLELTAERSEHTLFAELGREAALVDVDSEDGSLRHRVDVRRAMLEDLTDHVDAELIEAIDRAAIAFYAPQAGLISRAEEIYHRLRRREPPWELDARWLSGVEDRLKNAGDELPAQQRLWLAAKLGATLDPSVRETAGQEAWEDEASRSAERYLQSRLPTQALEVLHERPERLPRSSLFSLEAEACRFLERFDEALEVCRAGVESASRAGAIDMALELLLKMVVIEEGRDNLESAGVLSEEASAVASHSANDLLKLRTIVTRVRVHRHLYPEAHGERTNLRAEALELLTPKLLHDLRDRPVLLREVAAELAKDHAVVASAAIETLGVEVASDAQAQALGRALSTLNAGPSRVEPLAEAVDAFERFEFEPAVVREWVTKSMSQRDTRAIGGSLSKTQPGNQLLRKFRDYFREGVDSSLRGPGSSFDA